MEYLIFSKGIDSAQLYLGFYLQNQAKKRCHSRMFLAGIQKNNGFRIFPCGKFRNDRLLQAVYYKKLCALSVALCSKSTAEQLPQKHKPTTINLHNLEGK